MEGKQAAKLLTSAAAKVGKTVRRFCEGESSVIGTATFIEFEQTGRIPMWLQVACEQTLDRALIVPPELVGMADPTMGLGAMDLEADAMQ